MQDQSKTSDSSGIQDVAGKAQQKTGEIIDQAQEKVGEVAGKVKEQASSQISSQKDKAAESLGNVADAIRQTGEQLRQNEKAAPVAQYTDQLAQGVEMVSNYLRSKSLPDIVGEVERFARREPALFLGGALTIGLLAGRFLRSSGSSGSSGSQSQNSSTALAPVSDESSYGIYGSRSTGYSTALPTDVEPGFAAYDAVAESLTESYSDGSDVYSGVTSSDAVDLDQNSDSTGSTGYGSNYPASGYSSSYPTEAYGSDNDQSYGSQGRSSGGPIGGV
jgi:hypothetical protein